MVLRPQSPPSSPAPSAHRCAAVGLDRDTAVERWALVPSTAQPVSRRRSCRRCDLPRLGFVRRHEEFRHRLDLHVAVLQLPFVVLFQQHCTDQSYDRGLVGEYADHVGPSLHLLLYPGPIRQ
jgi:hypothetical protein